MAYGRRNWFHSRVLSSKEERRTIVHLVDASKNYSGLRWTSSTDERSSQLAKEINVETSQMRTKIAAFMRFGFIKKDPICPLKWTKLGEIWRSFVINGGSNLKPYTDTVEELIIASSLAFYSFDEKKFTFNPTKGYRPVFDLFQTLDETGFISKGKIQDLIAGDAERSNYSYWIGDLKNAGILEEEKGGFRLTNKFPDLFNAIKNFTIPTKLTDSDWEVIQNDTLDSKNPYLDSILSEMQKITQKMFEIEGTLPLAQKEIVEEMVVNTNLQEDKEIEKEDYKIEDSYAEIKIRRKQSAWSNKVRKDYNFKCCIPECDVESGEFLESAHIKKYSEEEGGKGHRANPHNGLCMCPLCHLMFDKGYFTLSEDFKIIISPKLSNIASNRLKNVIIDSEGKRIKMPNKFSPEKEYITFHQNKVFIK